MKTWFLLTTLLVACRRTPSPAELPATGQHAFCHCSYLTDYDDTANVDVHVCVRPSEEITVMAIRCAGTAAHNYVERCACEASTEPCTVGGPDTCRTQ